VENETTIEADHVYALPPDKMLTINEGSIVVSDLSHIEEWRAPWICSFARSPTRRRIEAERPPAAAEDADPGPLREILTSLSHVGHGTSVYLRTPIRPETKAGNEENPRSAG
jgi:hypothetical protein